MTEELEEEAFDTPRELDFMEAQIHAVEIDPPFDDGPPSLGVSAPDDDAAQLVDVSVWGGETMEYLLKFSTRQAKAIAIALLAVANQVEAQAAETGAELPDPEELYVNPPML